MTRSAQFEPTTAYKPNRMHESTLLETPIEIRQDVETNNYNMYNTNRLEHPIQHLTLNYGICDRLLEPQSSFKHPPGRDTRRQSHSLTMGASVPSCICFAIWQVTTKSWRSATRNALGLLRPHPKLIANITGLNARQGRNATEPNQIIETAAIQSSDASSSWMTTGASSTPSFPKTLMRNQVFV